MVGDKDSCLWARTMNEVIEIGGEEEDAIQILSDTEEQPSSKEGGQTGDALIISCQVRP